MCGIAGFAGPWRRPLIDAMVGALRHRGPDGDGAMVAPGAGPNGTNLALGHTRLAIIDLSDAAAQPMVSPDGRYHLTYNGEIYNYRALRDTLAAEGVRFATHSDTEVLLQAYIKWGAACLDRLEGIFAFAVWDAADRKLFLARDPLGVKPLYLAEAGGGLLFASEIKALTLCPDLPRDLDPVAVADHLGFVWTAGRATMLKAVRKLRPGECATWDASGLSIRRYWQVPLAGTGTRDSRAASLAALIDRVVADQMVADVPVGALLSGGVDSSAIAAAMARATDPGQITAFCAAVPRTTGSDNFGDDRDYAAMVAERLGIRLVEVPTAPDLLADLPGMVWALDEPTADAAALQTRLLAQAARDNGITVLLSGVGGDDLFTGYPRHRAALLWRALDRVPGLRGLAAAALRCAPGGGLSGRRAARLAQLLVMAEDTMLVESMSFSAVDAAGRGVLLAPDTRDALAGHTAPDVLTDSLARTRGLHPVERLLDFELNAFLPDHNLNYTDKMAMQAGVEVRVPLVDPRMVSFGMALDLDDRIGWRQTKKILRRSQEGRLPEAVLTRPKQGFGVPMRAWLEGPARDLMESLTSTRTIQARGLFDAEATARLRGEFLAGRIDAAFTLFPMMAIELWCQALADAPVCAAAGEAA